MDVDNKVSLLHIFTAIIAAFISAATMSGVFGVKNEWIAALIGLVLLYISGQICERVFGKEAVGGFKKWLSRGIVPFMFVWFVLWVMLFNYKLI